MGMSTMATPLVHPMECRLCGAVYPDGYHPTCGRCQGPTDIFYDLSRVDIDRGADPLRRYRDLLPVADPANLLWTG